MQVYKGLDIITNKVTLEEQAIIPHHLLDFVETNEKFSVVEFKTIALDVISDIITRQKVPIIVGGTNYYIESLLWKNLIDEAGRAGAGEIRSKFRKVENEERKEADPARESNTQNMFVEEDENVNSQSRKAENEKRNEDDGTRDANTESATAEYENFQSDEEDGNNSRKRNVENEERNDDDSARDKDSVSENTLVQCERNCAKQKAKSAESGSLKTSVKGEAIHTESLDCSAKTSPVQQVMDTESYEGTEMQNSLHQQLAKVDSAMAKKLHPNDTRKIKRSLQVYERSGITHSEHVAKQQSQEGSSEYSGPMRFNNVCVLWLQCEFETLDERLDARVDEMIEQGLVDELIEFHNSWKSGCGNSKIENSEGIFQSIGFKEFREFLNLENSKVDENPDLFQKCVEAMKCATRRYARKQVRWVNNRFLGRPSTSSPDVYSVDATDLGQWESNVFEKAVNIVKSFTRGEKVTHAPLERILTSSVAKHSNHTCTVCNGRIIIGDQNWAAHLRSRSHRHYKKKQQRFEDASTT
ncbi:tRNA dimethylallyltransferase, mitochondrial [Paramuricea clavata]|uniref:tRNA dimethylallyltransferase, mitochondrial n=1 Tax=Paramuricea clavata TaxID=317549 RepID=A0A7D9LIY7_PARCT|nr:tRNA dimethylallyltransferase, mitochondrial [Paramuricea clavata]